MCNPYKNSRAFLTGCLLILLASTSAWADKGLKAGLTLQKDDPYLYGPCGWCSDSLVLKENDHRKNINQSNLDAQTGNYLIDLTGPAGTTVTLYGSQNYGLKHGYLILVKKDDRPLAIENFDPFPPQQWVDVNTPDTGTYRVWYHPAKSFKERIASVRWGQWWSELPPVSVKE